MVTQGWINTDDLNRKKWRYPVKLLPTYRAIVRCRCYYVAYYHKSQSIFYKTIFSSTLQLWTKCSNIKNLRVATRNLVGIYFYLLSIFPGAFSSVHTCMLCFHFSCLSSCSFVGWRGIASVLLYEITTIAGGRAGGVLSSARCSKHASYQTFLSHVCRCI